MIPESDERLNLQTQVRALINLLWITGRRRFQNRGCNRSRLPLVDDGGKNDVLKVLLIFTTISCTKSNKSGITNQEWRVTCLMISYFLS